MSERAPAEEVQHADQGEDGQLVPEEEEEQEERWCHARPGYCAEHEADAGYGVE